MQTGISDFDRMVIKVLQKLKLIHSRSYKTFNANLFQEELKNESLSTDNNNTQNLPIPFYQYLTTIHPLKENMSVQTI